eukprot:553289-Rhodomonas_salina.1
MGKARDWPDRLWGGTEDDVTPGQAAAASTTDEAGPAPPETAADAPDQEAEGSGAESIDSVVDRQQRSPPSP